MEDLIVLDDGPTVSRRLALDTVRELQHLRLVSYNSFLELVRAADSAGYVVSSESAQVLGASRLELQFGFGGAVEMDDQVRAIIRNVVKRDGVLWTVRDPFGDDAI
jgi:hypothetical protein